MAESAAEMRGLEPGPEYPGIGAVHPGPAARGQIGGIGFAPQQILAQVHGRMIVFEGEVPSFYA